MSKKVLLSTDIGSDVDDALALLTMLNHSEIDLRGIYTVNGNVDARSYIAKHMVDLAGREIPIGRGEPYAFSLAKHYSLGENFLVDERFIDRERMLAERSRHEVYRLLESVGIVRDGVTHMTEQLSKESHTIFSIGPLTNIAKLLRNSPQPAKNIERLFVMGARLSNENIEELEHNFRYDSISASEVLNSDIPITVVPGDICGKYKLPVDRRENRFSGEVGKYVDRMLRAFIGARFARDYGGLHTRDRNFSSILKREVSLSPRASQEVGREELEKAEDFKSIFLANIDLETAYLETDDFWGNFDKFIEQLRNPKYGYSKSNLVSMVLEDLVPKDVSIADVYIPYCFLHPEKLRTERMTLDCDFDGRTLVLPGQKHEVVRDLDFEHFRGFLGQYLK